MRPHPFFTLSISQFIFYFSLLEDLAAIVALWLSIFPKGKKSHDLKVIRLYLILILIFAALRVVLAYTIRNNLIVGTTWNHVQFFLLLYFFYTQFKNKITSYILLISYLTFNIINTIYLEPITSYQKNPVIFSGFVFIACSIYLFHLLLVKMPVENILDHYIFWVNAAILIYFSGGFFVFVLDQFFQEFKVDYNFIVHAFVAVAKNLLLGKAFLVNAKYSNQQLIFKRNQAQVME